MARFWRVARGQGRQTVLADDAPTTAVTVAPAAAPRAFGRGRRLLKYLAFGLAAAIVATLVLYIVSRILATRSDFDWFHTGLGFLALVGGAGMIGAAVWNLVVFARRRSGRASRSRPRPLLIVSLAVFAIVPFGLGIVTGPQPSLRPRDAPVWAGYGTTRDGITQVSATWVQPHVHAVGSRPNAVALWVGLGDADDHLEQIGTDCWCQRHTPATGDAWYELYPAPVVETTVAVRPGDRITSSVVRLSADRFRLTLSNATSGTRFSTVQVIGGVGNTHGTIIVEEPTFADMDLAGFEPVHFTGCTFNGAHIGGFHLTSFDISDDHGVTQTTTSEVGADGASFTVTRR
jgi:Peptidase A4 family